MSYMIVCIHESSFDSASLMIPLLNKNIPAKIIERMLKNIRRMMKI